MSWEEIKTALLTIVGWEVGFFLGKWILLFIKILRGKYR